MSKVGGILLAIVLINLLPRVVGLPDVDLPAISLPDLPDWAHTVVKVKNWLLAAVVAVVVVGLAIDQSSKRRG
jgi:hypothetical protein